MSPRITPPKNALLGPKFTISSARGVSIEGLSP